MILDRIDHVVFTVRDLDATCAFYRRVLGVDVVTFGDGREARAFGRSKINLHQAGREIDPKAVHPLPGSQDICLVTSTPIPRVVEELRAAGVAIVEGPVSRVGATGPIESVYFRDPDGNLIEVARYHDDRNDQSR